MASFGVNGSFFPTVNVRRGRCVCVCGIEDVRIDVSFFPTVTQLSPPRGLFHIIHVQQYYSSDLHTYSYTHLSGVKSSYCSFRCHLMNLKTHIVRRETCHAQTP